MLRDVDKFKEYLNGNSLKQTTERIDIAKAVVLFDDTFTVDELMDKIKSKGWPVSKATLYRSIPLLIESGMIKPIASHQLNNHTFKRRDENEHDPSFDCQKCGSSINTVSDIVSIIYQHISEKYDFNEVVDNLLMLKGICPGCVDIFKDGNSNVHNIKDSFKIRIILLEDEDMLRSLLSEFLKERGFEVLAYKNPVELNLDCSCNDDENRVCCDFLISDIKMPEMSGIDFFKWQIEKNCRISNIAFISAYWTLEDLDYVGSFNAAIFHKPFNILELNNWIESCLPDISRNRILGNEFIKID
jgi:Fur family ferric uptake transcriptional regulator